MDNPKVFYAFLNGLLQKKYEGNQEITVPFLKEQLFANDSVTEEGILYSIINK